VRAASSTARRAISRDFSVCRPISPVADASSSVALAPFSTLNRVSSAAWATARARIGHGLAQGRGRRIERRGRLGEVAQGCLHFAVEGAHGRLDALAVLGDRLHHGLLIDGNRQIHVDHDCRLCRRHGAHRLAGRPAMMLRQHIGDAAHDEEIAADIPARFKAGAEMGAGNTLAAHQIFGVEFAAKHEGPVADLRADQVLLAAAHHMRDLWVRGHMGIEGPEHVGQGRLQRGKCLAQKGAAGVVKA
jgi:hypothetical protein